MKHIDSRRFCGWFLRNGSLRLTIRRDVDYDEPEASFENKCLIIAIEVARFVL
jgi:hypothetical protein